MRNLAAVFRVIWWIGTNRADCRRNRREYVVTCDENTGLSPFQSGQVLLYCRYQVSKERDGAMSTVLEMLTKYGTAGMVVLLLVQMIMIIGAMGMIRRLRKHVEMIQNKVQDYLAVVMEEDSETEQAVSGERMISGQERQMMESLARRQKVQQEEIFNAVLQEIFP